MPVVVTTSLPGDLSAKLEGLSSDSPEQYELIKDLILYHGQQHLFEDWMSQDVMPSTIREFADHLTEVDKACPTGLRQYIKNAQKLLQGTYYVSVTLREKSLDFY